MNMEQVSHQPLHRADTPDTLLMSDPRHRVQAALIELAYMSDPEHKGLPSDNVMTMWWIDSGLAEKFSTYIEDPRHANEMIRMNETSLTELLGKIKGETTLH